MREPSTIGLTIAPLQYWWPRQQLLQFYAELAESPADTIVLGEVTCSRRNEVSLADWQALGRDLQACGKTVRLSTMPLLMSEAELRTLRRIVEQQEFTIEAGDAAALQAWSRMPAQERQTLVLGPHINIYSPAALHEHLREPGISGWVPPLELSLDAVASINPPGPQHTVPTEVFGFGRMPLAFSARCFTARHHRLSKDQCEFRCREDADGLLLKTGEGQPFLALNGISTQSASLHCLIAEGDALREAGINRLRLSPCSLGFSEVLEQFDLVLNHGASASDALDLMAALPLPGALVHGFAKRQPGMRELSHA